MGGFAVGNTKSSDDGDAGARFGDSVTFAAGLYKFNHPKP
jgi:hypothetical protein